VQIVFYFPLVSFPLLVVVDLRQMKTNAVLPTAGISHFFLRAQYRQLGHFFPLAAHLRCKHRNSKLQYPIVSTSGLHRDVVYLAD
jgi:hypothetical protein